MSNTTHTPASLGYVTAYSNTGTVRHIVARVGDYFNGYATAAICGTAPAGKWGTGSGAIQWTADTNPDGYGDTVHTTPADAAAAKTGVCLRCRAAAAKMTPAEPVAAPVEDEAPAYTVTRAENVVPGSTLTGYYGPDAVTGVQAVTPRGAANTEITWITASGATFSEVLSNGHPVYVLTAPATEDAADTRATELAVMSAPGAVRVDTGRTLPANGVDGAAVATVTSYFQGGPGRGECVDAVIVTVAGGHSHPARVEAATEALERLQGRVSGNITAGEYQTIARGSRDTVFVFGTWTD